MSNEKNDIPRPYRHAEHTLVAFSPAAAVDASAVAFIGTIMSAELDVIPRRRGNFCLTHIALFIPYPFYADALKMHFLR